MSIDEQWIIQTGGFLKRGEGPPRFKRGPFNVLPNASIYVNDTIQARYIQFRLAVF